MNRPLLILQCPALAMTILQIMAGSSVVRQAAAQSMCSSSDNSCPENSFCNYNLTDIKDPSIEQKGFCQPCLDHPMACTFPEFTNELGEVDCIEKCTSAKICSESDPCTEGNFFFCNYYNNRLEGSDNEYSEPSGRCETCSTIRLENTTDECSFPFIGLPDMGVQDCMDSCAIEEKKCDADTRCPYGMFCANFLEEEGGIVGLEEEEGTCTYCKWHLQFCYNMGLTEKALEECLADCNNFACTEFGASKLTVNGFEFDAQHLAGTEFGTNIQGPIVDFGFSFGNNVSSVDLNGYENPVCLIERGGTWYHRKLTGCETRGGVAAIIYNSMPNEDLFAQLNADEQFNVHIPAITLRREDGLELLKNNIGDIATITTFSVGGSCLPDCSDDIPCPEANQYCDYDNKEKFGSCRTCPEEGEADCYFSDLNLRGAESCANVCGSKLTFPECKLCGRDVSIENLMESSANGDTCQFCPDGIAREYQNKLFPLFGAETRCIDVQRYFDRYEIPASNRNCELATMYNFACGCEGPGYMQAENNSKRNALVWVPRATAIISILGSSYIIYEVIRNKKKRRKMNNQMMAVLSVFDLFGSIAYMLTTLPIPEEDYIQGAKGNDATCTAQGFFIQLSTIAGFINVSLAVYYLMIIKFGWSEDRLKKYMVWFYACPIVTGLAFAFAGIPFYTNMILWCNNGAKWWPEIPVIIAIISATAIMGAVCVHVHKEEKASKRWRRAGNTGNRDSFSKAVFWQSIWYLVSFYFTWPPYLALQYVWSSGQYSVYWFVLFAGALVPMQGFWNCVAFKRTQIKHIFSFMSRSVGSKMKLSSRSSATSTARGTFSAASGASRNSVGKSVNHSDIRNSHLKPDSTADHHVAIEEAVPSEAAEPSKVVTFHEDETKPANDTVVGQPPTEAITPMESTPKTEGAAA